MSKRFEIKCANCDLIGRMTYTGRTSPEGKDIVTYVCGCDNPFPNFDRPFVQR